MIKTTFQNSARALAITLGLVSSNFASAGLIHLWEANGDATDSVGSVDGTFGGSYGAGIDGQAFNFTGSSPLFTAAVDLSPSNFAEVTFGAWFRLDDIANNRGWGIGHDNGGFDRSLILHDDRYEDAPAAGVGFEYESTLPALALNSWTFIAASYQGNGLATTVYSGGSVQEVLGTNNNDGRTEFTVGGLAQFANHEIAGSVDNVFIFDRALSVAELRAIEARGTPVPTPATLALMGLGIFGLGLSRRRKGN